MKRYIFILIVSFPVLSLFPQGITFDKDLDFAQVLHVGLKEYSNNNWTFDVTLTHRDTGWNHYADQWIIIDSESGEILGTRVLAHPHVNEQPFTRGLSSVTIDGSVRFLEVQAKCNLHDYSGKSVLIDMSKPLGDDYNITFAN